MGDDRDGDPVPAPKVGDPGLRVALSRYFARMGVEAHDVEDCVQDVFLRIVRRGDTEGLQRFSGYVFTTAASVLTDRHRRRRARFFDHHVSFEPDEHEGADFAPDELLAGRETLSQVGQAILALPERTRQVFVLRRLEQLSYAEIALRLGISVSAVEKHMIRAARHLVTVGKTIR